MSVLAHKKPSLASGKKSVPHKKMIPARSMIQFRKSQSTSTVALRLNPTESAIVASALVKPPAPNRALVDAIRAHKKAVVA